jgi:hypothetical protein
LTVNFNKTAIDSLNTLIITLDTLIEGWMAELEPPLLAVLHYGKHGKEEEQRYESIREAGKLETNLLSL